MGPPRVDLFEVQPIGIKKVLGFGEGNRGHGLVEVEVNVYPPEAVQAGRRYKELRRSRSLSLMQAAAMLHMSVSTLSELECGGYSLNEEGEDLLDDWYSLTPPFDRCQSCGGGGGLLPKDCPHGKSNCWKSENWDYEQ